MKTKKPNIFFYIFGEILKNKIMKKIYLTLLTALAGLTASAQLTDPNHSPAAGDLYSNWQCDSTTINPGAAGAGASWNFSAIATRSSIVNNYTVAANTNTSYPTTSGEQVSAGSSNTSYYKNSSTSLNYYGGNVTVGTTAATLTYTAPAVVAAYPMSLNTTSSAATSGSITVLAQNGTFSGNSSAIADGTGTLSLPNATFTSAYRVVTTQTVNFTASIATGTLTQKNYSYYDLSKKEALFTIATSTLVTSLSPTSSTQTIVTRSKPTLPTGINEAANTVVNLSVYPNPSNTFVNFATESTDAKQIILHDITGKLVEKQNLSEGKLKLDVSSYSAGIYMYSVVGSNNQTFKTGKITVSH